MRLNLIRRVGPFGLWILGCGPSGSPGAEVAAEVPQRVVVTVSEQGYDPSTIRAQVGKPLTLVFKRVSEAGCGQEVVFPEQNLRRDLPLNQEVAIELTPTGDTVAFTCGMDMYRGSIVVEP